jgi:spore maturation protein CgeB
MLHTESPYEDERQIQRAAHCDLNLVNDPTNLDRFQDVARSVYAPHAYRPALHHPGPPTDTLASDFAFVGTGYPSRIGFLQAMNLDGLDVLLAGNWQGLADDSPLRKFVAHDVDECLDNEDTADVYRSMRVGLNLYRREAEAADQSAGWSMGPREVEMAACGGFFLRDPRPESDRVLSMLPTVTGPGDAAEQLHYWLDRPAERQRLAAKAREAVSGRTFENHAASLLRLITK